MTLLSEFDQLQEVLRDLEHLGAKTKGFHKNYSLKELSDLLHGLQTLLRDSPAPSQEIMEDG